MESWVLEGDSYSFLSGAPQPFNLQNRDGPNRVEIFDITRIPSERNVISETTCLCDIFGDDGETQSLSSSPASTSVLKRAVDEVTPLEKDTNNSSGSYHTANNSEQSSDAGDKWKDCEDAAPCTLKTDPKSSGSVAAPSDGLHSNKPSKAAERLESDSAPENTGLFSKSQHVNSFSLTEAFPINEPSDSSIYSRAGGLLSDREIAPPSLQFRNTASSPDHRDSLLSRSKTHSPGLLHPFNASQSQRSGKSSPQSTQSTPTCFSETEDDFSTQDDCENVDSSFSRKNICPIPIFSIIPQFRDTPLFFSKKENTTNSPKLNRVNQVPVYPIIPHLPGNLIDSLHERDDEDFVIQNKTPKSPTDRPLEGQTETTLLSGPQEASSSLEVLTASVSGKSITPLSSEEELEVNHIETGHTIPSDQLRGSTSSSPEIPYSPVPEAARSPQSQVVTNLPKSESLPNLPSPEPEIVEDSPEPSVLTESFSPKTRAVLSSPELNTASNISSETASVTNSPKLITSSAEPKVLASSPEVKKIPYHPTPEPTVVTNSPEPTISPTAYSVEPLEVTCSGTVPGPMGVNFSGPQLKDNFTEHTKTVNSPEPELANKLNSPEPTEFCDSSEPGLPANFSSPEPTNICHLAELERTSNFSSPECTITSDSPEPKTVVEYSSPQPTSPHFSISPHPTVVASSAEFERVTNLSELTFVANSPEPKGIHSSVKSTERAASSQSITVSPEPVVVASPPVPEVITKLPDHLVITNSEPIVVTITPEPGLTATAGISPVSSTPEPFTLIQSPEPRIIAVSPESAFKSTPAMFNPACPSPEIRITYSAEPRTTPSPAENVRMSSSPETRGMSGSPHSAHAASPLYSRRSALTPDMNTATPTNSRNPSPELTHRTPNRTPSPFRSITSPQITGVTYSIVSFDGRLVESPEMKGITCSVLQNEMKNMAQSPDCLSIRSPESSSLFTETRNTTPFSELKDICSSPELNTATPEPEPCVSECSLELWSPTSPCAIKDTASSPDVQNRNLSPEIAATNLSPFRSYSPGQQGKSSSPGKRYVGVSPHGFTNSPNSERCHLSPISAKRGTSPCPVVKDKEQQKSPLSFKSTSPRFEPDLKDESQKQEICFSGTGASPTQQYSHINQSPGPSPDSSRKYPTTWQADMDKVTETNSQKLTANENLSSSTLTHFETASKVEQHSCWEENERWNPEVSERQLVGSSVRAGQMGLSRRESPTVVRGDGSGEYERWPCQDREGCRDREEGEGEGEESQASEKGEGRSREAGYRGEQVELSFSARNRRGPASYSAAPTSRDPKLGIPTHSYSEWLVATRQQQSQIRAQALQQESKGGARRLKSVPRSHNNNNTVAGRLSTDHKSETSSMGSEFDEADSEVKWLTDLAFRSLSSPQVDYLDMYNSSHRSSTNASQPSTQESPGAPAWMSYADLRGSSQGECGDDVSRQPPYVPPPLGGLDPSRRFELGSYECVDVALESREEARKGKRTVPKRQIQLKRRDSSEPKITENADCALDSPSLVRRFKDTLVRQHSSPVSIEEDMTTDGLEADPADRKQRMQKSSSLDETSNKTKNASCLIKNVLSKKMQTESSTTIHSKEDLSSQEDKNKPLESPTPPPEKELLKANRVSPSQFSDNSFPPVNPPFRKEEQSSPKVAPKVPPKPLHYTLPPLPQDISIRPEPRDKHIVRKETPLDDPLEGKKTEKRHSGRGGKQVANGNPRDKRSRDSANVGVGNMGTTATRALGMPGGMINRGQECHARPENHKQHSGRTVFMSKTPEIMLKPGTPKERKQTLVKVPSSPGLERKVRDSEEKVLDEKHEGSDLDVDTEQMEEDECETDKIKKPIHVVRDVRRLVKNTYNLSFKAASPALSPHTSEPPNQEEVIPPKPAPMQIECKAISRKDNKEPSQENDKSARTSLTPVRQEATEMNQETGSPEIPQKTTEVNTPTADLPNKETDAVAMGTDTDTIEVASNQKEEVSTETSRHPKLGSLPKIPSKDREVSKLVFQPEGTAKGTSNPDTPPSPRLTATAGSHSVSMILKEKGMQADIGVCEIASESTSNPCKHINRIEVPLQTSCVDATPAETLKGERDAIRQSAASSPRPVMSPAKTEPRPGSSPKPQGQENHKQAMLPEEAREQPDVAALQVNSIRKEAASPMITRKSQPVSEVKPAGEGNAPTLQKTSKEIELPIQVRSISYDRPKPVLPTKPSCKQPLIEIKSISHDKSKADKPQPSVDHSQNAEERKAETGAHGEIMTKTAPPVHTNKLAVSARSSYRPPPSKMATVSSLTQKTAAFESLNNKQLHAATAPSVNKPQMLTVSTSKLPGQLGNSGAANVPCTTQQQAVPASSSGSVQTVEPLTVQAPSYTQQLAVKSSAKLVHTEHVHFYASDDPPSYDDRESFSPYLLPDLPPRRSNRYHPNSRPPPCSCSASCSSHPGHPRVSPHTRTPPMAPHSPGQSLPYPGAPPQAQVRPHQCRLDGQPLGYKPGSPKGPMMNPTQQPSAAMYQPLHHPPTCPGPLLQSCGDERQPPPGQHMDRRQAHHPPPPQQQQQQPPPPLPPPPPQQQMPGASGGPYSDHLHPSNIQHPSSIQPPIEPRPPYLCSPQDLASSYGPEYGPDGPGGGNVMYPDGAGGLGYGQGPRRVLLDPDTGKYFYIEVPMQPLRKMLFDPETGQYVEVLIPQQALSHSGLYPPPPPAAPYSSLHGPSMYAPQYLPYPVPTHPQAAHPPRNPEPPVPTTLHQTGMGYGNPGGQVPKSELQNQPPLDQGYLESMYYIPTGMNASPNTAPLDCYHKPSNLPNSGSRRP
ncbi:hypothetical protein ACEWY4_026746 [Coilia grayii]|uniref:DUF4585 domain-containing protein n=1 Tax=Coilia grayii TaxID=363190 RepID=A0ABD1IQH4_9TELE